MALLPFTRRPAGAAPDDRGRLHAIEALGLLHPVADEVLEDVARRAAVWLSLPQAGVSVLFDEALHFAALHGGPEWLAAARAMPVEWSFCRYAVAAGAAVVVEDTARDPRTCNNPLVYLDGIRCYAGVPLVTAGGHVVGTLCVTGTEARAFTAGDLAMLRVLAREVVTRLESRVARPARPTGRPRPRLA